jgi:hypothetical protein
MTSADRVEGDDQLEHGLGVVDDGVDEVARRVAVAERVGEGVALAVPVCGALITPANVSRPMNRARTGSYERARRLMSPVGSRYSPA